MGEDLIQKVVRLTKEIAALEREVEHLSGIVRSQGQLIQNMTDLASRLAEVDPKDGKQLGRVLELQ